MEDLSRASTPAEDALDPLVEWLGYRLSTATVLFHTAIADRLGVSVTDVKCYSVLRQAGPLTAGEIGERLGLTTGAVTGVIDRLTTAGLAQRCQDPADRRRVIVELLNNPEHDQLLTQLYAPLGRAITALVSSYSETERATILDFITKATSVLDSETTRLRQERPENPP
jgi:DNA-binding MarR family transcriptional regulator